MLTIKEKGILENIINHCSKIIEKGQNLTYKSFLENEDTRDLICFHILQIGELVENFDPNFIIKYPKQPWSKIRGMRNVVAHGYGTVKKDEVWNVVINQIKPLKDYCQEIIKTNEINEKENNLRSKEVR